MEGNVSKVSKKGLIYILIVIMVLAATAVVVFDVQAYTNKKEAAKVVLYDPGSVEPRGANDRTITVDGKDVFVYATYVDLSRSWIANPKIEKTPMAYFDFSGTVTVKVKATDVKINKVTIRPLSLNIKPKIEGDTITFKLDKPTKLTLEINDDVHRAMHIFANPIEVNPPKEGDPNVIYFGPGVHEVGNIKVASNQTVYIAGGAVVHGNIKAEKLDNLKIMGHGIIDGSVFDRYKQTTIPIDLEHCTNTSVEGIMLLDPAAWTLNIHDCKNIKVDDIKIISARSNSDGITIQSCSNVAVSNSFVRSWDDSLVVKGYDGDVKGMDGNVKGITFDNMIVWTDLAQSCEVGYETRAKTIEDVHFSNITVLHNFHKPVMSIHNGDSALVKDIHFDNITVEDAQMGQGDGSNLLIEISTLPNTNWNMGKVRGNIRDVFFNNINVLGGSSDIARSHIEGSDETHTVENVSIKNLKIYGVDVTDAKTGRFYIADFAKNITFGK
jgi:hypothetical protein